MKNLQSQEISINDILKVEKETEHIEEDRNENQEENVNNLEIIDKILETQKKLTEIDDYFESLSSLQSKKDEELSDLLHYIENNELTPRQCIKIVNEIKKKRIERRQICNDIEIKRIYEDNRSKMAYNSQRELFISNICKRAKTLNNEYKNRQYTDDDFKKILKGDVVKNV